MVKDNVRAHTLGHRHTNRIGFHTDDEARALELRARGCAKTDGALRENGNRVSDLNFPTLRGGDAGGGDISEQDDLFVAQATWNLRQIRLRRRNEKIFSLRAVDGVAEFPSANGPAALGQIAAKAIFALAAGSDRTDEDAVADRIARHTHAKFVNHADRFMADD